MEVIYLENVNFAYNTESVLKDINVDINAGDYVGLIGPNGSGKSTLVKIILGLIKPQSGIVRLFGKSVDKFEDWGKIGYVGQRPGSQVQSFPVTAMETLVMSGVTLLQAKTALEEVDMERAAKVPMAELSGGQQQRVYIARALAKNPELLILDEPTAGVDTESQADFYSLLKKLNETKKITLLLVSHDVDVIAHEVNHLLCINKTIVCHGKPKEVLKDDFWKKVYGQDLKMVVHGH